ncbi:hypothetical protein AYO47_03460 [Planctomyces sp. SCGC AG-212-M04]|nr:hypothetical protein AYO47_03460 [Planctomyces sp. SCGC AG-212-M04]
MAALKPEFEEYARRHGIAYVTYKYGFMANLIITPVLKAKEDVVGFSLADRIFVLPCASPTDAQLELRAVRSAVESVVAYLDTLNSEVPEWLHEFSTERERVFRARRADVLAELEAVDREISTAEKTKGVLYLSGDALVDAVKVVLKSSFDLTLEGEDVRIDDAKLIGSDGTVLAVFEIKGVKSNVKGDHIRQVDSHRERLELPDTCPGILIINSLNGVRSLKDKDQPPHHETVTKAVKNNVLILRTLDLLRFKDGIQQGKLSVESFRRLLLGNSGWLRVDPDFATEIVQQ